MSAKSKRRTKRPNDEVEVSGGAQPAQPGELWFDPWLSCTHLAVKAVADNIAGHYEYGPTRKRRPKQRDVKNLHAIVHAIVSNLAFAVAVGADPPRIRIGLRGLKQAQSRYGRKGFTGLPRILKKFRKDLPGMLTLIPSERKGASSTIEVGASQIQYLRQLKFRPDDFTQIMQDREIIYLGRTERDYVSQSRVRELCAYEDTNQTRRYRSELERINAFLAKAKLDFVPDDGPFVATGLRQLRRNFNLPPGERVRFDLGGRLSGGWWMSLPKARRGAIRIDGERIADLDFKSMFINLAYAAIGEPPRDGDAYAVPSLTEPQWRPGVKKVALAMLFRESELRRLPRGAKGDLPNRVRMARVRDAILRAHPKLKRTFETGIGLSLMFTESQILIAALLLLIDQRIPALPMHDGLMVAESKMGAARAALREASKRITGFELPVELKP